MTSQCLAPTLRRLSLRDRFVDLLECLQPGHVRLGWCQTRYEVSRSQVQDPAGSRLMHPEQPASVRLHRTSQATALRQVSRQYPVVRYRRSIADSPRSTTLISNNKVILRLTVVGNGDDSEYEFYYRSRSGI